MVKGSGKYENARIYKMEDNEGYFYIGSTLSSLNEKKRNHKNKSKVCPEKIIYKRFNESGWDTVKIRLLQDNLGVTNIEQLLGREDWYIQRFKDNPKCLNTN